MIDTGIREKKKKKKITMKVVSIGTVYPVVKSVYSKLVWTRS